MIFPIIEKELGMSKKEMEKFMLLEPLLMRTMTPLWRGLEWILEILYVIA